MTVTVGMIRKIVTRARNGKSGKASRMRLLTPMSADRLGPVVLQIFRRHLGLVGRRHGDRPVDDRDLLEHGLVDGAGVHHQVGAYRPYPACGEQVLALVAV